MSASSALSQTILSTNVSQKGPWSSREGSLGQPGPNGLLAAPFSLHVELASAAKAPQFVHVVIEAFYASIEQTLDRRLTSRPVIEGATQVISASSEARLQGICVGMAIAHALQLCPDATVLRERPAAYETFTARVRDILESHVSKVRDGLRADFGGSRSRIRRYTNFEMALYNMQASLWQETGLHATVAAAGTKCVAAIAAAAGRARGIHIVPAGRERQFLTALPVTALRAVGESTAASLNISGVSTIGELQRIPCRALQNAFGDIAGKRIWQMARGLDTPIARVLPLRPSASKHNLLREWMAGAALHWRRT